VTMEAMMEGPKRIYLFPGIASGYESRTFPDEIEYTRADLTDALAEAADKAASVAEITGGKVGIHVVRELRAALAAYRDEN
jgi:hypothetical protein